MNTATQAMHSAPHGAPGSTCRLNDLPIPPGLPLIGHLHRLNPRRLHLQLEAWARDLGPMYRIGLGGKRRALVCSDTERMQEALRQRPQRYRRMRPIEAVMDEMGGNVVFSVEGEAWLPQRRLVMQALAPTHFKAFFPVLQMHDELTRFTVDATTVLVFGEDPNTIDAGADVLTLLLGGEDTTAHPLSWTMPFLSADPGLQQRMHERARVAFGDAVVCPNLDGLRALDDFEARALVARAPGRRRRWPRARARLQ